MISNVLPRASELFAEKYGLYGSLLFKVAMIHLGNKNDAEEAVQETFIKLLYKAPSFHEQEHEKAWLIRVMTNHCKNMQRSIWRRRVVSMEDIESCFQSPRDLQLFEEVVGLPFKYKAAIHLFYYEDYTVRQIAETLSLSESAVKMRLQRGRQLLKLELEGGVI